MSELRVLFNKADNGDHTVRLDNDWGGSASEPVPLAQFLTDDDFEDLRWYLEDYMDLPDYGSIVRAQRIEGSLAKWGRKLYNILFKDGDNRELLNYLESQPPPRLLTVATRDPQMLHLPWELMADSRGPLCRQDITIRRQLETARKPAKYQTGLPLRILLVVSRPGDLGFIDPRLSTRSMLDALKPLGEDVRVDFCRPPTLPEFEEMLSAARSRNEPYHIVHFDGHGTFLPEIELGALCFEQPDGATGLAESRTDYVRADRLGDLLAAYEIPLVILEACRTGTIGKVSVFRSVAPRLIEAGVGSVISMGFAVHVEAARVLLERFYRELVTGVTVGQALEQGRGAMIANPHRWIEYGPGGRTIELADWHLPHLYQRGQDIQLVPANAARAAANRLAATAQKFEFDAFLSYSHADAERVKAIHSQLTERGLRVFLDEKEITHGPLHEQCRDGITKSRFLLLACSRHSLNSDWVLAEHDMARARDPRGRNIIPLVLDDVDLPLDLRALLWRSFANPGDDLQGIAAVASVMLEQRSAVSPVTLAEKSRFRLATRDKDDVGAFPPAPVYGFQGRAHELYDLERQFRSHRAVLLHAMGGMGKTTLAGEAALWWTRTGLFPDGACFVSFEQFASAERVIQVLGTYLDGNDFNSLPADDQRRRAKQLFQEKSVLMVWDNFESILPQFSDPSHAEPVEASAYGAEERERLYELFQEWTESSDGHGRLLITCRPEDAGLPGALRHELRGLARPDSLWLLSRVLETAGVDLNDTRLGRDRLNQLLDLLADHPLSIELVGPHLKTLTPEQIIADFGKLLDQFKRGAGEQRNESLLASLAFSTSRLSEQAQAALPWLGMFSGGVFEYNLLGVSGLDPQAWEAVRAELEATALIRVERDILFGDDEQTAGYLRFHPTLAYACAGRSVPNPDEARKRFVAVYGLLVLVVREALDGSDSRRGMGVVAREEANYRRAVSWVVEDRDFATASALGGTLRDYLDRSGRLRERDAWVMWLTAKARKGGFSEALAELEREEAWTFFTQGHGEEAIHRLERLIRCLRETAEFDSTFQLAKAKTVLGRVLRHCGMNNRAIEVLEEAVAQWELLVRGTAPEQAESEYGNLSASLGDLANTLRNVGHLNEALAASERGLDIDRTLGHQREVAVGLAQCAAILMEQGRYAEADARYEEVVEATRRAGDKHLEGSVLQHRGVLAFRQNNYGQACRLLRQSLKLSQEMDDGEGVMRTCSLLGIVERDQGRLAEASAWNERSREIAESIGNLVGLSAAAQNSAIVCQYEGEKAHQQGREQEAVQHFEEAKRFQHESLGLFQQVGNKPHQAVALSRLAQVHLLLGELPEAERYAHQSREIHESLGLKEVYGDYDTLADIARARGDEAQAGEWERKRDAVLEEMERRARGPDGGGVPAQLVEFVQVLARECAQAGFGADAPVELSPEVESAISRLSELPVPFSALAAFLHAVAERHLPPVPSDLPPEISKFLTQLTAAAREAGN
jgi:tetratricopeptide (TPR) repeat protein